MINENFLGNKKLLNYACSIHDLWKSATLTPEVIIKEKGSLFKGHGSQFPSNLVYEGFEEIEFDDSQRKQNLEKYYVLNLIRLHHSGFSTYNLFQNTEFIYELGDEHQIKTWMTSFIKDWYALKTADWIDSSIMEARFKAKDIELGLASEIDIAKLDENNFSVVQEGFISSKIKLNYRFIKMPIEDIKKITETGTKFDQRRELNKGFLDKLDGAEIVEVYLK